MSVFLNVAIYFASFISLINFNLILELIKNLAGGKFNAIYNDSPEP